MVARINITGQIGNSYNEKGELTVKGVQLQDVISQVNSNKEAEILQVYINSGGGDVEVGKLIANYISGLNNTFTIADEVCGSIATEIHLSVPLAFRKIIEGTKYFIHNPLLQNVSGNADELRRAADAVEPYEKDMLSMYVKATGLDKSALQGLMKQATSLTDVQAKEFGFASEILPKQEFKAVAFFNNNQNQNEMSDLKEIIADFKKDVVALLTKKEPVKAMKIKSDKGELEWASDSALPVKDEVCMLDGAVAPEGTYTLEDGTVITIGKDGIVTDVKGVEAAAPVETIETLQAKLIEVQAAKDLEIANLKTEMEASVKAELETLKAEMLKVTSTYKPAAAMPVFNKGVKKELSMKEMADERKKEYKQKK